jgi:thiosulfate reductase cytochrome b subunit
MAGPIVGHRFPGVMIRAKKRELGIHSLWVRVTHWSIALALSVMFTSGWRIYDASPLFKVVYFPNALTLGGWLGGALLWHFAAMWLLVISFLVYVSLGLSCGHFRTKMMPIRSRDLLRDASAAFHGRLHHKNLRRYNAVQKVAYLAAIAGMALAIVSGLGLWKPVQLLPLSRLMGGYDATRFIHFIAMASLAAFIAVHLAMVILVPRSLPAMLRGH